MSSSDRRNRGRTPKMLRVSTDLGDKTFRAHTYNISVGGAFVQTAQQVFPKGSIVPLEFKIPADCQGSITAVGEVVRIVRKTGYHGNVPGFALRWITVHIKGLPEIMDPLIERYFGSLEGVPLDDAYKLSRDAKSVIEEAVEAAEEEVDQTALWQQIRAKALETNVESEAQELLETTGVQIPDHLSTAKNAQDLVQKGMPMDLKVSYRVQSVSYVGTLKQISPTELYVECINGSAPQPGTRLRLPIRIPMGGSEIRATMMSTVEECNEKNDSTPAKFRASIFHIEEDGSPGVLEAYLTHEARMLLKKNA